MSNSTKIKRKKWFKKLSIKHRLVIMNDQTFAEVFSFKLSPLSLFVVAISGAFLLIFLTTYLIAFTSLKEYIPGYSSDVTIKRNLIKTNNKIDSLSSALVLKDQYITNIQQIVTNTNYSKVSKVMKDTSKLYTNIKLSAGEEDSTFRAELENQDQATLQAEPDNALSDIKGYLFYPPVNGIISDKFKSVPNHLGIDIVGKENEAVKATLRGTIIFANWTLENGFVIQIQHANDMISMYKHNSSLLKKVGEKVNAGDVIAIIGNSGELSSGPHLHFELWRNGKPLNPAEFIKF